MATTVFDPAAYKETTRQQWDSAAEPWHRWGPTIGAWLGPATELRIPNKTSSYGKLEVWQNN